ncbi:MAG TPA: Glu/Leu/Phe/Val dehydrogenase dimerization domain-containing protein [Myxococcaceae bacterium]|nr:Glu/Leu/Phe/Val dehydrogenase dimerization domain-containing protein [Myxococcaceae bacterium]
MELFNTLLEGGYEGLHLVSDAKSGLRGLVGIHSTRLGPALGGTRALSTYASEADAIEDVLRLARGMTYKAALAGLPLGGGKGVIMLPRGPFDRARLFEAYGRAVEGLGGRYITSEDAGTSPADMELIRRGTRHVVGMQGRGGDPSPVTAFGVVRGIEAAVRHVFGRQDLKGLRVNVLGVGHVGLALVGELHQRGAKVAVADVAAERVAEAVRRFGATALGVEALVRAEADVYAPCALGGAINDGTVPLLRVKVVAGAANNQLAEPRHGEALAERGIVYVPDYAINAGGLVNVAQELAGYDRQKALDRASRIHDTIAEILRRSQESGMRPEQIADRMVEEKLAAA